MIVFLQTCLNRPLRVHTNTLIKSILFGKILFFWFVVDTSFDLREKLYGKVNKTNFHVSENCFKKQFFFDFFVFGTYSDFEQKHLWLFRIKKNTLAEKLFFEKFFFILFPNFELNSFWLSANICQGGCQNCSLRVQETHSRNRFFVIFWSLCKFGLRTKPLLTFGNFSWRYRQKCFVRVQKNSLKRTNFLKNSCSIFIGLRLKLFLTFAKKFTKKLSKLISTFSENIVKK